MAVRTQLERARISLNLKNARRNVISRTARIWTRLYKQLVPELKDIAQKWIEKLIKQAVQESSSGYIDNPPKLSPEFTQRLRKTLREAYAQGWWLNHLYVLELEAAYTGLRYRGRITLADTPTDDELRGILEDFMNEKDLGEWESVIPQNAIDWLQNYTPTLAGNLSNSVLEGVREVMRNSLQKGSTLQERMKELRESAAELSRMAESRIESIARTEITRADTLGRLSSMKSNDDVIGVEFSAVMDDRTTEICSSRHGLVMRLDDPRLPENTPPCHVSCRSLLIPCTVYDYPDGLLTSHEFEEVPAGTQRPEDIQEVMKVLTGSGEVEMPALEIADVVRNIHPTEEYQAKVQENFDKIIRGFKHMLEDLKWEITEEDLQRAELELQKLTTSENTHIAIRFDSENLDAILNDGRFKSVFETKTTNMDAGVGGAVIGRAQHEYEIMGYPSFLPMEANALIEDEKALLAFVQEFKNMPNETFRDRPIYGALVNYKNPSEVVISSGRVAWAGDISAIMKREVKSYATMTGGDSADLHTTVTPAPLLKPNRYAFDSTTLSHSSLVNAVSILKSSERRGVYEPLTLDIFRASGYAEVQIHGGQATVSNIEHLIIGKETQLRDDQVSRLKTLGITWSREGEDTIH